MGLKSCDAQRSDSGLGHLRHPEGCRYRGSKKSKLGTSRDRVREVVVGGRRHVFGPSWLVVNTGGIRGCPLWPGPGSYAFVVLALGLGTVEISKPGVRRLASLDRRLDHHVASGRLVRTHTVEVFDKLAASFELYVEDGIWIRDRLRRFLLISI